MPNKDADDKNDETERGDDDEKSTDQNAKPDDRREKRKLPEPPGNLKRRGDWFKKRH
jgi:hypothetical protein